MSVVSCVCHHPSGQPAQGSGYALRMDSPFHCNGEKPNHYIIFPQPLLTPTKMSPLHLQLEQLNVFPALVNPQRHLRRTCLCSSCCLSQPLLLLFFIPYLLRDVIKKIFSLENPSTLPQRAPFWISALSFLSFVISHFHRHWLPYQLVVAPRLTPTR